MRYHFLALFLRYTLFFKFIQEIFSKFQTSRFLKFHRVKLVQKNLFTFLRVIVPMQRLKKFEKFDICFYLRSFVTALIDVANLCALWYFHMCLNPTIRRYYKYLWLFFLQNSFKLHLLCLYFFTEKLINIYKKKHSKF